MRHNKVYYFSLKEILEQVGGATYYPYNVISLKQLCTTLTYDLTNFPVNVEDTLVVKLWNEFYSRFYDHAIIKKEENVYSPDTPSISNNEIKLWLGRFLSILNRTWDYYSTLLSAYTSSISNLMDDIKTTTTNKNYFNDTPQNPNTQSIYEGDDYISNFSKNINELSTPLTSKIMRLKEIQDNFLMVLDKWTRDFERVVYEEEIE